MELPRLEDLEDDGLITPEIKSHSLEKYRHIAYYATLFSTGMKRMWQCRVYIDLFSGAGRSKVRDAGKIVSASPLLALNVPSPFDKYIFCEADSEKMAALKIRSNTIAPTAAISYIEGDSNEETSRILSLIPRASREHKVLSFCLIDPYRADHFSFNTIIELSSVFIDFLVLIPSYMDINRNTEWYQDKDTLDRYLGTSSWRAEFERNPSQQFGPFIARYFANQMKELGFMHDDKPVLIRGSSGNLLYHLAFFSKSAKGIEFWGKSRFGVTGQTEMF